MAGKLINREEGIIPALSIVVVSVAAAIILSEAQHQRDQAGLYGHRRLDEETYQRTLFCWAHPKVADYCDRHQVAYPSMHEDGNLDPEFLARYRQ